MIKHTQKWWPWLAVMGRAGKGRGGKEGSFALKGFPLEIMYSSLPISMTSKNILLQRFLKRIT